MNNSFARLIDGMCTTLRQEVLTRLDDDFARGQVFGVINLLNTFKVRADWSAGFLLQQIDAQQQALDAVRRRIDGTTAAGSLPELPSGPLPVVTPVPDLLARRDAGNQAIAVLLAWLDAEGRLLPTDEQAAVERDLRSAMDAEVQIELRHSPRPLFAEMSSGREG